MDENKNTYVNLDSKSYTWGSQQQVQRWKAQLEEFRQSNCLKKMQELSAAIQCWEPIEVRVEYCPRTYFIGDPPENHTKGLAKSKHWTWKIFEGQVIYMPMFNDEGNSERCMSEFRTSQELRGEVLAKTLVDSLAQATNKHDTELSATHLKGNAIPLPQKWWDILKRNWTPNIRGHQCFESWNFEKRKVADVPNTWMRIHRTQNSCFAQFTQQICAVSTEQFQAGVKSSLNGLLIKKSRPWNNSQQKQTSSNWKIVKPQELVQIPCIQNRASGNRLRECLQRFETLENGVQFTRVCEDATFAWKVSVGMSCKTIPDVHDGFWDRNRACREYTHPREDSNSRINAMIPGQTVYGPVLQVHITRCHDISGTEIPVPSKTTKHRTSWMVTCRRKNGNVEELHLNDPDHNPTSSELLLERSVARERELERKSHPGASRKLMRSSWKVRWIQCANCSEQVLPIEERKWNDIPACRQFRGHTFEAEVSKLATRLGRRYDQDEKETDGAVQWNSMGPKLQKASHRDGGQNSRTQIGFNTFLKEATRWGSSIFTSSRGVLWCIGAVKDTHWWESDSAWVCGSRRNSAQMERMPWRCSYDATSILKSGLFAGGGESKEGRQTIFFTPLKPFGDISDEEEPRNDLSKPRKAHHHSKWKSRQDAVCWIIPARAQDEGLQFRQTRSHDVIVCGNVPADCICKVISQKGKRTFFERLSTPRPAQKIVLKSAWQSQQQQQQQQDTSEGAASGATKLARKEEQGNPTDNPELPSARKLEWSAESPVEKEPEFKVDLRIEGIAQDVIFKDEERMGKIQENRTRLNRKTR